MTVFVSGLVIFFANAITLALDASINSSAALAVSSEKGKNYMCFQVEHTSGVWLLSS